MRNREVLNKIREQDRAPICVLPKPVKGSDSRLLIVNEIGKGAFKRLGKQVAVIDKAPNARRNYLNASWTITFSQLVGVASIDNFVLTIQHEYALGPFQTCQYLPIVQIWRGKSCYQQDTGQRTSRRPNLQERSRCRKAR